MDRRALYLHEEVLLLALRDREGTLHPSAWVHAAMGGAILAELFATNRIALSDDGKQSRSTNVEVLDATPFGEPVLDDCLGKIRDAKTPYSLQHWAGLFGARGDLFPLAAGELCRLGILREDEKKVLFLFSRKVYPELDGRPEEDLITRLRSAIYGSSKGIDERTRMLLAIAEKTGLLYVIFGDKEIKQRKEHIAKICEGDVAGDTTEQAVNAANAALMLTIAPMIAMTATFHSS